MLSKEECLEALKQMTSSCEGNEDFCLKNCDACSVIKQLIKEHFELKEKYMKLLKQWGTNDNPPLKFEDLEKGIPVWDSINDCWVIPFDMPYWCGIKIVRYVYYFDKSDDVEYGYTDFEENRFYRYEVKE